MGKISRVEGVNVVFIGPADLSQFMGFPGEMMRPELTMNVGRVIKTARENGKTVGTVVSNGKDTKDLIEKGIQYFLIPTTGYIYRNCKRLVEEIRSVI